MRKLIYLGLVVLVTGILATSQSAISHRGDEPEGKPAPELKLENLLKAKLEGVDGTEVIVSRVTMPPHTTLPKHWHPGEEFGYVLEGSVILWQDGKDDIVAKKGDTLAIPLQQVHTAITKDAAATLLVFRVHEEGKPERTLVE